MNESKIVITGLGLISPLGSNLEENWRNLKEKKTGIGYYPQERCPNQLSYLGKIPQFQLPNGIPHKLLNQMKFLNRSSLLGFVASHEAVSQSRIDIPVIPLHRRALYIGAGDHTKVGYDFMYPAIKKGSKGGFQEIVYEQLNNSFLHDINPFFLLESLHNNLFGFLSVFFGFKGPNTSLASLSPCGAHALELGFRSIKQCRADIALVVGCSNWITEIPLYELEGIGMLSRCKHGVHSYKPFDKHRDGLIPGEGAAAVLLESEGNAKKRGAEILAKVKGMGNCIDFSVDEGFAVPTRSGERSMKMALEESGCDIEDLAFISPHGSATKKGDKFELAALNIVLGNSRSKVPICGMKPYTSHMGAASDIAEIILSIKSLKNGMVPATLNFEETEREFSELWISTSHETSEKRHFLSTSYGMGGQFASIVIGSSDL